MSRSWSSRHMMAAVVAVAGVALALGGCSPVQAGAAATYGNNRITTTLLDTKVNDLRAALNGADPQGATPARTVSYVLQTLITNDLVMLAGAKEGVQVTPTEVAVQRATLQSQHGGKAGLDKLAAQQGIPPSQLDAILESNLIIQKLGKKLAPSGTAAQQQTAVRVYLTGLSAQLKTKVSPRYGTWDSTTLSIAPVTNSVSTPAPSAS